MSTERESIINSLFDSMSAMKRYMFSQMDQNSKVAGLSHTQVDLLVRIKHMQPINFSHLAQQLRLTPGAVSQLIEGLEKQGLVGREPDPDDRRVQYLRLTKPGDKHLHDIEKDRHDMLTAFMKELTTEELATWARIQQKMLAQFQSNTKVTKHTGDNQ